MRNTCHGRHGRTAQAATESFDEQRHVDGRSTPDPESLVLQSDQIALIERAMTSLPDRYRALLVLRELEGLSYRELADAMDMPMGTVMSSLSRARQAFRGALVDLMKRSDISQEIDRQSRWCGNA